MRYEHTTGCRWHDGLGVRITAADRDARKLWPDPRSPPTHPLRTNLSQVGTLPTVRRSCTRRRSRQVRSWPIWSAAARAGPRGRPCGTCGHRAHDGDTWPCLRHAAGPPPPCFGTCVQGCSCYSHTRRPSEALKPPQSRNRSKQGTSRLSVADSCERGRDR